MKRIIQLFLITLAPVFAYGQQAGKSFTLEQCIEYALQNAISAQDATLDQQIAAAKVKETIGIGLPQISGAASAVYNPQLQRFFMMYTGNGGIIDPSNVPGIKVGDVIASQNFFQLKSSANVSLGINQLIFNGSYIVGLKAASTYKDLAYRAADQTNEQIIMQVTKAYYAVLINKERVDLFTDNIARVDSLLRNTKALNTNGFAESIDVDRVRVTYNNLISERDKFLNMNDLGLELLKFQMNYPMDQPIIVTGSIQDVQVDVDLAEYQQDWDYKNRPDYKTLEVNRRLQELNIKNQIAGGVPSISAFANMGYMTQSPNVGGLFKTNSNIEESTQIGPDKYYSYSQIGLNMSIPIFTGLSRSNRIQQEKLSLLKVDNSFRNLKNSIDLDIQRSTIIFNNALKTLAAQKENQELAGNVARVTKIKYEQGVGTNLEVVDAEDALRTAQTNYYSALFDAMVAKVDIDKAYGKILPVTETK
ncbi:MAG TPA: TolC family protein [Cyclobacteriaceae bacterium]|jgi:outer membrane protein TolC|nr:TolC family protein [Cyclobacteriaceae bacterium]